jgi:hypothetical protein
VAKVSYSELSREEALEILRSVGFEKPECSMSIDLTIKAMQKAHAKGQIEGIDRSIDNVLACSEGLRAIVRSLLGER